MPSREPPPDLLYRTLSHELRGALGAIAMWTHLLRAPDCDERARTEAADAIDASLKAQFGVLDAFLELGALTTGAATLTLVDVPLAPLVDAAAARARDGAGRGDLTVDVALGATPAPIVRADATRLARALEALVLAAIGFAGKGGKGGERAGGVRVSLEGGGDAITVYVGEFFDEAASEDPQVAHARGGLALLLTREIVRLHGGTVDFAGRGFRLTLPAKGAPSPVKRGGSARRSARDR